MSQILKTLRYKAKFYPLISSDCRIQQNINNVFFIFVCLNKCKYDQCASVVKNSNNMLVSNMCLITRVHIKILQIHKVHTRHTQHLR